MKMASKKHQFIIDCLIRKMRILGFEPICHEGTSVLISDLNLPPKIIRHRPDGLGFNIYNQLCIIEAKTENDISCKRTKEQICDYYEAGVFTLLGCPRSVAPKFQNIIKTLLPETDSIHLLPIPDELMPNA